MKAIFSRSKRGLGLFMPFAIICFSALLLKFPALFGLASEKVTLALLTLIGVEFLLERLTYFEKIPQIAATVDRIEALERCFGYRGDFGSMEDMIKSATREIFISGLNLNALSNMVDILEQRVRGQVRLRVLIIEPNERLIEEAAAYFDERPEVFGKKLEANLSSFHNQLQAKYPELVELRTIQFRPAFGYALIDADQPNGYIRVESYTCSSSMASRPMMQFKHKLLAREFEVYSSDLKRLWDKGRRYAGSRVLSAAPRGRSTPKT